MRRAFAAGVLVSSCVVSRAARADDLASCVSASEQAQSLRDRGKYKDAREQLLVCTREVCPAVVKKDCIGWLIELDMTMPHVVISVRDAKGEDIADVKVSVDGRPFASTLDGTPLPIDPGRHTFRYEAAGVSPVEKAVIIHAGEKIRSLNIELGNLARAEPSAKSEPLADVTGTRPSGHSPWRTAGIVVTGVGIVALGVGTVFGLRAKSKNDESMTSGCIGNECTASAAALRDDALSAARISTATFIAGGLLAAGGVALWVFAPGRGAGVQVAPTALSGGGGASVAGRWP